ANIFVRSIAELKVALTVANARVTNHFRIDSRASSARQIEPLQDGDGCSFTKRHTDREFAVGLVVRRSLRRCRTRFHIRPHDDLAELIYAPTDDYIRSAIANEVI